MIAPPIEPLKKNAIVCLVRGKKNLAGYGELVDRNASLQRYYSGFDACDNLIFHEGDVTEEQQEYVCQATPNCMFITLPEECFSRGFADRFLPYEARWRLGYKHMCRFFAIQIYPLLKGYEYYWRLDDDCSLHGELPYDPFQRLSGRGKVYGYIREKRDGHKLTAETLPGFALDYLEKNFPDKVSSVDVSEVNYYNNFHVSEVEFWLRPEVAEFLRYVDESGGIYKYRWGDSTIQAIALRMFSTLEQRMRFPGILYEHKSHNWKNFR